MNAGSIVTFNGTTIYDSNFAQNQGGAIAVSASSLVLGSSAITFINNSALSGSAMYLMSSSTSSVDLMIPLGGGCTTPTICTTPPGSLSTGYITRAFYGRSDATMPPPGCNNAPYDLWVHELGVCTKSYKNYIHGSGYGVYSLIPSTTGGFPQLIFEQYGTTTTGMHTYNNQSLLEYPRFISNTFFSFSSIFFAGHQNDNPCAAESYQGYITLVVTTTCTTDQNFDVYRYLSATPSTSIVVPAAPSEAVYSVSVFFSGVGCTGAVVTSSIALKNDASEFSSFSYYYFSYTYSQPQTITCAAPANGTCNGHNFQACPTAGLTFATIASHKPLISNFSKIVFRNNVCRGGKQGGTVFVVKDPQTTVQLFGPQMTYYNQRVVFVNNTAEVGKEIATQITSLRSTANHTTIIVTDYNFFLRPSLMFHLVDAFNNINTTDYATTVSILWPMLLYPTLSIVFYPILIPP